MLVPFPAAAGIVTWAWCGSWGLLCVLGGVGTLGVVNRTDRRRLAASVALTSLVERKVVLQSVRVSWRRQRWEFADGTVLVVTGRQVPPQRAMLLAASTISAAQGTVRCDWAGPTGVSEVTVRLRDVLWAPLTRPRSSTPRTR